ncbi:acyl-CoA dehydrogenase family protein [Nocardioides sp.]|uniref:acyl-CoA dehydrogenase family protein n=1 Tax=Nocardioides sp. TaxID=35761 RepID=UPI00260AFCEF|nr:acyl-CoA dehydrogenase family protein [Nocardioides sp.]MDI6909230.1 acyl-CoA dehydrogenase family protein [Nocardioides sp.]
MTELPSLLPHEVDTDLRDAVAKLLEDRSPIDAVLHRCDAPEPFGDGARALWAGLTDDLGVAGLPLAETEGGAEATWRETAVVVEALGRAVADIPFFISAVMATSLAQAAGATGLLRDLATGHEIGAVVTPFAAPFEPRAEVGLHGSRVAGRVSAVAGALESTQLLVPHPDALLLVRTTDATITPLPSLDMTRRVADVELATVEAVVLAEGREAQQAVQRAAHVSAAMLASEQLGLAEYSLESTVQYLQQRRQFGRVVGSFQALKHRLADLWTLLIQARAVARYAAACAGAEEGTAAAHDLPVAASLAQSYCGPVAVKIAEECVQLHGGIGFTWEHPAHLYLKRAKVDALALGSAAWHRRELAKQVDL